MNASQLLAPYTAVVTCRSDTHILQVCQRMQDQPSSSRHCVLVTDRASVVGIVTAKDIAYRGVAENRLDSTVDTIMTTNPVIVDSKIPLSEAIDLMARRGIRHLPVTDNSNTVIGVLDIAQCFHNALKKVEKQARELPVSTVPGGGYAATSESSSTAPYLSTPHRIVEEINKPLLKHLPPRIPPYISPFTTVYDACCTMVRFRTTAVLVRETNKVIGIFTTKDCVFRVLAKGIDPGTCTVTRAMTSRPTFADPTLSVRQALELMYQGHFMNLPVNTPTLSLVSVLQLTQTLLEHLVRVESSLEALAWLWNAGHTPCVKVYHGSRHTYKLNAPATLESITFELSKHINVPDFQLWYRNDDGEMAPVEAGPVTHRTLFLSPKKPDHGLMVAWRQLSSVLCHPFTAGFAVGTLVTLGAGVAKRR